MIIGITRRFIFVAVGSMTLIGFLTRHVVAVQFSFMSMVRLMITTGIHQGSRHDGHKQSGISAAQ